LPLVSNVRPLVLERLRFPWIYVVEFVLWIPLGVSFVVTVTFLASKPVTELELGGRSLPPTWEAAVPNHGKFLEGYLLSRHPAVFGAALALLFASAALLYVVHKEQLRQAKTASGKEALAHKGALAVVFAAIAATGYFALTRFLVGMSPT
jgi:hypothetical protein